jgi:hypothetical protein
MQDRLAIRVRFVDVNIAAREDRPNHLGIPSNRMQNSPSNHNLWSREQAFED